jgi:hypothetical protein
MEGGRRRGSQIKKSWNYRLNPRAGGAGGRRKGMRERRRDQGTTGREGGEKGGWVGLGRD